MIIVETSQFNGGHRVRRHRIDPTIDGVVDMVAKGHRYAYRNTPPYLAKDTSVKKLLQDLLERGHGRRGFSDYRVVE